MPEIAQHQVLAEFHRFAVQHHKPFAFINPSTKRLVAEMDLVPAIHHAQCKTSPQPIKRHLQCRNHICHIRNHVILTA